MAHASEERQRTTADSVQEGSTDFRVGGVLRKTFILFPRHIPQLLAVTLVPACAIQYLVVYVQSMGSSWRQLAATIGIGFGQFALQEIAEACILFGLFQAMRGRRFPLLQSLGRGGQRLFPVIGLSLLFGIALSLAFILLVFPALMLLTRWLIAPAVCVVEQRSPSDSFTRSAELSQGNRWRLFGIIVLEVVAGTIGEEVIDRLVLTMLGPAMWFWIAAGWQALYLAFDATVAVVIYHDLRVAKEGIDIERIASVFD